MMVVAEGPGALYAQAGRRKIQGILPDHSHSLEARKPTMQNRHRPVKRLDPFTTSGDMGFEFSFAFQPIVNVRNREIISYEALVRGPHGESSASVFARVPKDKVQRFDEVCRRKAIGLASRLNIPNRLNLNLSAQSLYEVDLSIMATFQASIQSGLPVESIVFEVVESECLTEQKDLIRYLRLIQDFGFSTAIDDFGAGYSGLKLLVEYQPHYIKLDRHLIGNIHQDIVRQRIFSGIQKICESLSIDIVAEGVETVSEYRWLYDAGISIFQGFYFARPAFEALPLVTNEAYLSGMPVKAEVLAPFRPRPMMTMDILKAAPGGKSESLAQK
jgi:EAL domain-containing protein (putative c-di-GMP-specific phosphodiesterase class I)